MIELIILVLSVLLLLFIIFLGLFKLYLIFSTGWCRTQTCLVGKTAIVTGANSGLGYQTALEFAKRGARVILACRNKERGKEACQKIIQETGNKQIVLRILNTGSLKSVREFSQYISETEERLDILVNNAGVGGLRYSLTEDGLETVMAVNYLGPFLLTHLLLGLLIKTENSRIVNVSSLASIFAIHSLQELNKNTWTFLIYAKTKLFNIYFTQELASRIKALKNVKVSVYSVHPGFVKTEFFRNMRSLFKYITYKVIGLFMKSVIEGAQTQIYAATAKNIEHYSGDHFSDCKRIKPYFTARNKDFSKKLWNMSRELVKLEKTENYFYSREEEFELEEVVC